MRFHQITRATLSFALAAIGLLAVATPASATEVFKTRVELNRVVHKVATHYSHYSVKGRIHSGARWCAQDGFAQLQLVNDRGNHRPTHWSDGTNSRGEFSIRVPQSEEGKTFRVIVRRKILGEGRKCDRDKSRRFTLRPASEAGVAAAPASAAADVVKYDTRLTIAKLPHCCRYQGDVKSEVKKCIDGRRVVLFRQGRKVGTARSNENGVWGLDDRGPRRWYAKVRREVHDGFVCKKDRTATKPLTK
jgi:hypothetical protein